jgi:hypothetical protein
MPIAVHITCHQMSKDDYERVIAELEQDGAPHGRVSHTTYGDEEQLQMFDVWESHEHFEPYHDRLVGAMQAVGCDAGIAVRTDPVHRRAD